MMTDYMYQEKREEEDLPVLEIQRLEDYIEKHEGRLITSIRNDTDNTMDDRMTITWKHKMGRKITLWTF